MTLIKEMSELLKKDTKFLGELPHKETIQDLFDHAEFRWGLSEEEVRRAIKAAGHSRWNNAAWEQYIEVLRKFWLEKHIAEQAAQGITALQTMEERIHELYKLQEGLKIVWGKDCWTFEGTPEQMAAHWELEELLRKRNMQRTRRRYQYYGPSETNRVP